MKTKVLNKKGEKLDVWVEGNEKSDVTVLMAHGFGTDKHETDGLFDDISQALVCENYRVVRFDFSGFGESEGKSEDFDLMKGAKELDIMIEWVRNKFGGKIYLIAQSMATAMTVMLQPKGIIKTVFQAHVNPETRELVEGLQARIMSKEGGKVVKDGVSLYPRSSGEVQKIGYRLWETLGKVKFVEGCKKFGGITDLLLIRPKQDQIVSDGGLELLKGNPEYEYVEVDGDHSFRGEDSRKQLCQRIVEHFAD